MKKLLAIVLAVALVGICSAASAATILPDNVLGELYAGQYTTDINSLINSEQSAVAQQSNIAAIVATEGGIYTANIENRNFAKVKNIHGESAVAFQSNVAAIVANGADNDGATITNTNIADVKNIKYDDRWSTEGSVEGSSIDATFLYGSALINDVYSTLSAIAAQSNIGAIVNLGGNVSNARITQTNCAKVFNLD